MEIGGGEKLVLAQAHYKGSGIQDVAILPPLILPSQAPYIGNGDITSISTHDLDNIADAVKISITKQLVGDSPLPACCCIFRVPPLIRRQNIEAYTPDIISIGPFHRNSLPIHRNPLFTRSDHQQFQFMENVKQWYLQYLLMNLHRSLNLESLIKAITKLNIRARECYSEKFDDIGDEEFVEMMILDGCFLLELFQKALLWRKGDQSRPEQDENDPILNLDYMFQYLYHDLLLLENQLPWFVLECLYDLTVDQASVGGASLADLVCHFFKLQVTDGSSLSRAGKTFHILDLIRSVMVASFNDLDHQQSEKKRAKEEKHNKIVPHCLEFPYRLERKEKKKDERDKKDQHKKEEQAYFLQRIPNATTLSEAGIKFKKREDTTCIMNISFKNGVLTIPRLQIDETTGPLFRNLVAYEQCHHARIHKITSYAVLMDSLIDTSKDIDLLVENGILVNWLSSEDAAKFFNDLYNDTVVVGFYYEGLCEKVNKYYNKKWNKWMEKLRRGYFSTPWAVISVIAAFILLALTLLQTVFTGYQL